MNYDPFKRGELLVGVRTIEVDATTVEVWYPADNKFVGQDLAPGTFDRFTVGKGFPLRIQRAVRDAPPAKSSFPLVLYSHAAVGHRRDAAAACSHLASHGYIVASAEFAGDTAADILHDAAEPNEGSRRIVPMNDNLDNRERIAVLVLENLLARTDRELSLSIDESRVGAFGVSLGGWTTLRLLSLNRNVNAAFIAAPSWGTRGPFDATKLQHSRVRLNDWERDVPIFLAAGEQDSLIPLEDMRELNTLLPTPKRYAVLKRASHFHWFEDAEKLYRDCQEMWETGVLTGADLVALRGNSLPFSVLCPNEHGLETLRVLCVAHMDAHLKSDPRAQAFLSDGLATSFASRGIDLSLEESLDMTA